MRPPASAQADLPEPSLVPIEGWHCSHYYYRFDPQPLARWDADERRRAAEDFRAVLATGRDGLPERLQSFIVAGHRADFGWMALDPDPLKVDAVHQAIMASRLGAALIPTYSFVSMTETSEYLPSPEQFAERLEREGEDRAGGEFEAKVEGYRRRLPMMRSARLYPDLSTWPATCFYPMNKIREVGANWFTLPFSQRAAMMGEHAQSGMAFGGRVTQLVTAAVGLDDWEWGVTLWARNPQYLKEIVYKMRFDQASARYAQFGPFYTGYVADADQILQHCRVV
jgi:peroxiredoxin